MHILKWLWCSTKQANELILFLPYILLDFVSWIHTITLYLAFCLKLMFLVCFVLWVHVFTFHKALCLEFMSWIMHGTVRVIKCPPITDRKKTHSNVRIIYLPVFPRRILFWVEKKILERANEIKQFNIVRTCHFRPPASFWNLKESIYVKNITSYTKSRTPHLKHISKDLSRPQKDRITEELTLNHSNQMMMRLLQMYHPKHW